MNKGKVELKQYSNDENKVKFEYLVEQNNGNTSVDQIMTIRSEDGLFNHKWTADLNFNDFPPQETPQEAANKLADWMERLAASIRSGNYLNPVNSEFKDLDS